MFMSVDFRLKLKWIFLITLQVRSLSGVTVDTGQCDCVPDSKPCTKEAVLISIASAFSNRAMACLPGMRLCCDARTSPRSHNKRLALTDHIRGFVLQIPNMVNRNRTKSRRQYLGVKGRSSSISTFTEDAKNNQSKFETTTTSLLDDNNKNLKLLEVMRKHTNDGIKTGEIDFMNPQLRPQIYDGFSYFKNDSAAVIGYNESKISPINQTLYAGITGRSKDEENKNKVNLSEESIMPCNDGKCITPVINNTDSYIENIITVISMPSYFNYGSSHNSIEKELHGSTVNPKSTEMFTSSNETLFESNEGLQTFQKPSYETTKEHSLHQSEVYSVQVAESNVWTSSINILVETLTITSSQFITNDTGLSSPPITTNYSTQFGTNSAFEKPSKVEALQTVETTQSIVGQLSTEINKVSTNDLSEKTVGLMPSQIMSTEFETNSQAKEFFVGPTESLYNSYNSRPLEVESNVITYLSNTNTSEFLNPTEVSLLASSEVSSVYPATKDILSETLREGTTSGIDGSRTPEVDKMIIKNITDEYHRNSISIQGTELKSKDKEHQLPMIYNTANPNSSVLLTNFENSEYTNLGESHNSMIFNYSKALSHGNINSSQNQPVSQSALQMQNISGIVATPVWEMALKPNGTASNEEITRNVSVQDLNEDNLTMLENVTTAVPTQVANENFGYVPHQTVLMSSLHIQDEKNVSSFVDNNSTVELVNLTVTTHTNDSFSAEGVETKHITDVTHGKGTLTYHITHTPSLKLSIHSSNDKFASETYSKGSEGLPEQFRNFLLPSTELAITDSNIRFTTTKTYFIVLSPASTSSRIYSTERKHFHRYTSVQGYPQGSEMKYRPTFIKPSDNSQKEFNEYLQAIREESVKSKSGKDKKFFNWVFG